MKPLALTTTLPDNVKYYYEDENQQNPDWGEDSVG
jgi:hypothetical protein